MMKITGSPEVIVIINNTSYLQKANLLIQEVLKNIPAVNEVFLHHLVPGRSGALVCLALTHSLGTHDIPIVIKLGPKKLLMAEATNYDKYVLRKLRTAPLLFPYRVVINDEMAICYELAGWTKSPNHIITYMDYFNQQDDDTTLVARLNMILEDLESWWKATNIIASPIFDYYKIYSEEYFVQSLINIRQDIFARFLSEDPFTVFDFWNSLKTDWPFRTTLTSIIHGDLHSTNILIDTEKQIPAIIDFGSVTQNGHILADLTKLEKEIRCRLMGIEKIDFEQHIEEQEFVETFHASWFGIETKFNIKRRSSACNKAQDALTNIYLQIKEISNYYENYLQFLAELYVSTFFQTLLVTMSFKEDYPGQKIAAINSCFRLKIIIEDILSRV